MTLPFTLEQSTRIAFGAGRLDGLADDVAALAALGAKVLLVGDRGVARAGLVDRAKKALERGGLEVALWAELDGEPGADDVGRATAALQSCRPAVVVAVGGGSALDLGKLAAAAAPDPASAESYALCATPLPENGPPVICVPTTAGTGSEVTRTSVFTDRAGRKLWAWGDALRPRLALLDPTLAAGLPAPITAMTGLDALVHAFEAATSCRTNPLSQGHALQAIRLITLHLETAVRDGDDLEARSGMLVGACLAGLAIDGTGTGVAHAIGHALGTLAKVPHGRAVALALRAALDWNVELDPGRYRPIAEAIGLARLPGDAELAKMLAARFDQLVRGLGVEVSLAGDGLDASDEERLCEVVLAPENRPMLEANARPVDAADAARLARDVLSAT